MDPSSSAAADVDAPIGRSRRTTALRVFNVVMLVVGGVALWWILRNHSWATLAARLASIGLVSVLALALLDALAMCFDAAALHTFMRPEARMVSYWRVLGAQASARSINTLTPGAPVGIATKYALLAEYAPRARVVSSLVLLNLAQLYLSVAALLIGAPVALFLLELPSELELVVIIALAIIIPAAAVLGFMVHRGALRTIVGALGRARIISSQRMARWAPRVREIDHHIGELHRNRTAGTWKGIIWLIAARLVLWCAAILQLVMLGVPLTPTLVIGLLSLGVLVTWLAALVPFGIGLADGGSYALFLLLGATGPQGLLVAFLNRARSIIIAMLGLAAFAVLHVLDALERVRVRRKIAVLRERFSA